jgi:hypothetical protein
VHDVGFRVSGVGCGVDRDREVVRVLGAEQRVDALVRCGRVEAERGLQGLGFRV